MALAERKKWIVKTLVDEYVASAEPVGSKTIAAQYESPISSATIRNEMAELEEEGFLEQPYTSAGRIPTDKAYRLYVDELMLPEAIPSNEKAELLSVLGDQSQDFTELLQKATLALSESTGYTSVTLTPSSPNTYIKQFKLLSIEPGRVLVVIVLSAGLVKDRVIRAHEFLQEKHLEMLSTALEKNLHEIPLKEITLLTIESAVDGVDLPDAFLNQLLYESFVTIKQADQLDVYMEGVQKLFIQPEFSDASTAHHLYNSLQKDGLITGYLNVQDQTNSPFMIRIGQEIALDGLDSCSLVSSSYQLGQKLYGKIGIIGPKRMDYEKVIPRISFISEKLIDNYDRRRKHSGETPDQR